MAYNEHCCWCISSTTVWHVSSQRNTATLLPQRHPTSECLHFSRKIITVDKTCKQPPLTWHTVLPRATRLRYHGYHLLTTLFGNELPVASGHRCSRHRTFGHQRTEAAGARKELFESMCTTLLLTTCCSIHFAHYIPLVILYPGKYHHTSQTEYAII